MLGSAVNAPLVDLPPQISGAGGGGAFALGFSGIDAGFSGLNASAFENPGGGGGGGLEEEFGRQFDGKGDRRGYNRDHETFHPPARNRDDDRSRRRGGRY